jgi:arsenate reductase
LTQTPEGKIVLTIYGIPNCDTCRKARKWLDQHSVAHEFHDLRIDGLNREMLNRWVASVGWQKLLNTRSTTWRGIPEPARQDLDTIRAQELMLAHPTLVKRPVLETASSVAVGFDEENYRELIG